MKKIKIYRMKRFTETMAKENHSLLNEYNNNRSKSQIEEIRINIHKLDIVNQIAKTTNTDFVTLDRTLIEVIIQTITETAHMQILEIDTISKTAHEILLIIEIEIFQTSTWKSLKN